MNDQLEQELPAVLDRIAGAEPTPADLVTAVLRRARRRSAARLAAAGTGVAAATAVAIVTGTALAGGHPVTGSGTHVDAAGTGTGTGPQRAVTARTCDGVAVDDAGRTLPQHSQLLDRATGQYLTVPYCAVLPSPDGTLALVRDGDGSGAHPARTGVLTVASRQVRWIAGYDGVGSWSPDGRAVVLSGGPTGLSQQASLEPGNRGFVIVDAATARVRSFLPVADVFNPLGSHGVWTPDGAAIAITACTCTGAPRPDGSFPVTGIRLYDLRGHLVRTLPATQGLWSEAAYSPDGSRMVLTGDGSTRHLPLIVADSRTGAVRARVPLPADSGFEGWYDDRSLVVRDDTNDRTPRAPVRLRVIDLAGHVIRTVELPAGPSTRDDGYSAGFPRYGSAAGLPGNGDALRF